MENFHGGGEFERPSARDEILRIIGEEDVDKDALFWQVPELYELEVFQLNDYSHDKNILDHSIAAAKKVGDETEKLALLFHDLGKPKNVVYEENYTPGEPPVTKFPGHTEVGAVEALPILDRILEDKEELSLIYKLIALHDSWYEMDEELAEDIAKDLSYDDIKKLINVQTADLWTHKKDYAVGKHSDMATAQQMVVNAAKKVHENE